MSRLSSSKLLTILFDLFLLWVVYQFALGGWENAQVLLIRFGLLPWLVLVIILSLLYYRSDWQVDLPIFLAGLALGYWGEWWGTTRGVWTYWNGATPPVYLPPLWGIGVLNAWKLQSLILPLWKRPPPAWRRGVMLAVFFLLPVVTLARSWPLLMAVDWRGRLDVHFFAGLFLAIGMAFYRFEWRQTFLLFLCGTLLGGFYEYMGTTWGEWVYITGETPPWWIAPLWGYAVVAMVRLAELARKGIAGISKPS
jgi:hypothetical protein